MAIPEGFSKSLSIGAQYSLWPRLGFRWLDALQHNMPDLSLRTELGESDRLIRFLVEGSIQVGLMYTPQLRPGLSTEKLMEEELVLVASWADPTLELADRYVFVDWGPEFVHAHAVALPGLTNPGLSHGLGAMAAEYLVQRERAAYLPARYVERYLDSGHLHLVPGAPVFPFPIWSVWRDDLDPEVAEIGRETLAKVVETADVRQNAIMDDLRELNEEDEVEILGSVADIIPEDLSG